MDVVSGVFCFLLDAVDSACPGVVYQANEVNERVGTKTKPFWIHFFGLLPFVCKPLSFAGIYDTPAAACKLHPERTVLFLRILTE
jgi:hypothetical protein